MTDNQTPSEELLLRSVSALLEAPVPQAPLAQALAAARRALGEATAKDADGKRFANRAWRTLMRHKRLTFSAAAAVVVGIGIAAFLAVAVVHPAVAFSEVLKKMSSVQTMHARITYRGKTGEVWAKRPNKLRIDYADGTYDISNGPTMWTVDPQANEAVQKPSFLYRDAQRRGQDVLDVLVDLPHSDNFSGFFSEGPVSRTRRDGKAYNVYRMDMEQGETKFHFEALVDAKTHLLHSMKLDRHKADKRQTLFALTMLDLDKPIPDEKFIFKPAEGMKVTIEEARERPTPAAAGKGSTLSGRIVWASSRKPVGGARLTIRGEHLGPGPDGKSRRKYFVRAETDRDGRWKAAGAPAGKISLSVRSWELNWPAVPTFQSNVGSAMRPAIRADGRSDYAGLNFEVYKPGEYLARITINVTDENGKPVPGVGANLVGRNSNYQQHVYAARGKQFTDARGRFQAANIWPTDQPVRVILSCKDSPAPYAAWAAMSGPFVVKPKASHHFDMVLPLARQVRLKVVDPAGKPVEGLSVQVISGVEGWAFHLLPLSRGPKAETLRTDGSGLVTIGWLAPDRTASVILKRPSQDTRWPRHPLASACLTLKGPKGTEPGEATVTFDERPIRIEGTVESPPVLPGAKLKYVRCLAGLHRWSWISRVSEGAFVLQGLPPGRVRLGLEFAPSRLGPREDLSPDCRPALHLEPGHTYTVKITGNRVKLIEKKPAP